MSLTTPTSDGKFSFAADCFYVESSRSHDNVGHWYEAQLLHYGIPASKSKAVAKMRLFDAVQSGVLAVPRNIEKIESDLAKQWKKKDRLARAGKRAEGDGSGVDGNKRKRAKADEGNEGKAAKKGKAAGSTEKPPKAMKKSLAGDASTGEKESGRSKKAKTPGPADEKSSKAKKASRPSGGEASGSKGAAQSKAQNPTPTQEPPRVNTAHPARGGVSVGWTGPVRSMESSAASPTEEKPRRGGGG